MTIDILTTLQNQAGPQTHGKWRNAGGRGAILAGPGHVLSWDQSHYCPGIGACPPPLHYPLGPNITCVYLRNLC